MSHAVAVLCCHGYYDYCVDRAYRVHIRVHHCYIGRLQAAKELELVINSVFFCDRGVRMLFICCIGDATDALKWLHLGLVFSALRECHVSEVFVLYVRLLFFFFFFSRCYLANSI